MLGVRGVLGKTSPYELVFLIELGPYPNSKKNVTSEKWLKIRYKDNFIKEQIYLYMSYSPANN